MDLVQISRIEKSVHQFGDRFIQRVFTPSESSYALAAPALQYERLAARFAAKEACIKALNLSEKGVNWRDMEVCKQADGSCTLILHGAAQGEARSRGITHIQLSLSHDGDYAAAVVVMVRAE
ncbi:MAG: holo-ACP synthase [Acidobacteriota bacterium]